MMRRASEINETTPWQELTPGGEIYEGGTSLLVNTGDWRTETPLLDVERCKLCMLCVLYCPDSSVLVQENEMISFDLMHCKGCGICAEVCPFSAISMGKGGA